uniref:SH2 domain containing 2A n=1 Tax=Malurus cyaneus samueli TaxID=2593467 RepID=A0A8C5X4G3_9PASS
MLTQVFGESRGISWSSQTLQTSPQGRPLHPEPFSPHSLAQGTPWMTTTPSSSPSNPSVRTAWPEPSQQPAQRPAKGTAHYPSTSLWFQQTQAQRLGPKGELPAWFHGFISRREAEELLQDQPLGCFLVRFSESTVGFVLSYRGRDRCRHFVLDQLPDGRYVILGERRAHAELAELLQHHAMAPVTPYHEFLTVPLPCGWVSTTESPGSPGSIPATRTGRFKAKRSARPDPPAPPEAKYQQLMRFHIYAEPQEDIAPNRCEPGKPSPEEPIPFYAMARGWSPRAQPEENIYSEVAVARQDLPTAPQNAFSTLSPKPRLHRRLFRSVSSQDCKRRQLSAAPSVDRKDRAASSTGTQVSTTGPCRSIL